MSSFKQYSINLNLLFDLLILADVNAWSMQLRYSKRKLKANISAITRNKLLFKKKNWDSLHTRLNSHYEAWSYKKKKHKKIKAYKLSSAIQWITHNVWWANNLLFFVTLILLITTTYNLPWTIQPTFIYATISDNNETVFPVPEGISNKQWP